MKTVKIIAREQIIDYAAKKLLDDEGLIALDGYSVHEIEADEECSYAEVLKEFAEGHPELKNCSLEVVDL